MKIQILNSSDSMQKVWSISRPNAEAADSYELLQLDLPVSEFFKFDLKIESSIFIRELFCSLRDHVVWAQTSRVQNVLEFEMVDAFVGEPYFEDVRKKMISDSETMRQDNYRLNLPLFSKTTYSISISARHLINIAKNIQHISNKCSDQLVKYALVDDYLSIIEMLNTLGIDENIRNKHTLKPILNEGKTAYKNADCGDFLSISAVVPVYLRAQLVRHRQILVSDSMFELVTSPDAGSKLISDFVNIQVIGSRGFLKQLLSKRSCWIAQYDIWSDFLNKIAKYEKADLPCDGGVCPFAADVELRVEGKDPNPPCPKYLNTMQKKASVGVIARIKEQYNADNRPAFWINEISKLES